MTTLSGRPNRWVLEPLWIAGFWFFPFATAVILVLLFISPPSEGPDFMVFAIALAFVVAFVGLSIRGAMRRPPHPR